VASARHRLHNAPKSNLTLDSTRERGYTGSTNNTADGSTGSPNNASTRVGKGSNLVSTAVTVPATGDKKKSKLPVDDKKREVSNPNPNPVVVAEEPAAYDSEPEPDSSDEEEEEVVDDRINNKPSKPPRPTAQRKSLDSNASKRISEIDTTTAFHCTKTFQTLLEPFGVIKAELLSKYNIEVPAVVNDACLRATKLDIWLSPLLSKKPLALAC